MVSYGLNYLIWLLGFIFNILWEVCVWTLLLCVKVWVFKWTFQKSHRLCNYLSGSYGTYLKNTLRAWNTFITHGSFSFWPFPSLPLSPSPFFFFLFFWSFVSWFGISEDWCKLVRACFGKQVGWLRWTTLDKIMVWWWNNVISFLHLIVTLYQGPDICTAPPAPIQRWTNSGSSFMSYSEV